jgi:hypothetical protein
MSSRSLDFGSARSGSLGDIHFGLLLLLCLWSEHPTDSRYWCHLFQLLRATMRITKQCGCSDTHSGKVGIAGKKQLDCHKKEPREVHAPGVSASLLPQLVGSSVQAAIGVGGWGRRPDGPTNRKIGTISLNTTLHRRRLFATLGNRRLRERAHLSDCADAIGLSFIYKSAAMKRASRRQSA